MAPLLYELSVPVYIRSLEQLLNVLKKGEEFAKQTGKDVNTLAQARLSADMNVRNPLCLSSTIKSFICGFVLTCFPSP